MPSGVTVGAAKQLGKRKLNSVGESQFYEVQRLGKTIKPSPPDDEVLAAGSTVVFSGSLQPNEATLEEEVSKLRVDNQRLKTTMNGMQTTMNGMQTRMNAIALRTLADGARVKINGGQVLSSDDKTSWNQRLERGELDRPELTRRQLALTKYGHGTLQEAGKEAAHTVSVEAVAYAVTTRGNNHRALFEFVYGVPAEECVFTEPVEEEEE